MQVQTGQKEKQPSEVGRQRYIEESLNWNYNKKHSTMTPTVQGNIFWEPSDVQKLFFFFLKGPD